MASAGKHDISSPISTLQPTNESRLEAHIQDEAAIRQGSDLFENWKDKREGLRLLTASKAQRQGSRIFREHKQRRKNRSAGGVRSSISTTDFTNENDTARISTAPPPISSFYTPNVRRRGRGGSASVGGNSHAKLNFATTQPVIANAKTQFSSSPEPSLLHAGDFIGILPNAGSQVELTSYAVEPGASAVRRHEKPDENNDEGEILSTKYGSKRSGTLDFHNDDADDAGEFTVSQQQQQKPPTVSLPSESFTNDENFDYRAVSDYSPSANSIDNSSRKPQQRPTDINGVTSSSILPVQQPDSHDNIMPSLTVAVCSVSSSFVAFIDSAHQPPPPPLQQQQVLRTDIDAKRNTFFASLLPSQQQQSAQYEASSAEDFTQPHTFAAAAAGGAVHTASPLFSVSDGKFLATTSLLPYENSVTQSAGDTNVGPEMPVSRYSDSPVLLVNNTKPVNNGFSRSNFVTEETVKVTTTPTAMSRVFAEPVIYPPVLPGQLQQQAEQQTGTSSPLRRLNHFSAARTPLVSAVALSERRRRSSAPYNDDENAGNAQKATNDADRNDAEYFEEDNRRLLSIANGAHRRRSSIDSSMQVSKSLSLDAFESLRSEIDGLRSKVSQKEHALLDEKRASAALIESHRHEITLLKDDIFRSAKQLETTQTTEREELLRKQQKQANDFAFGDVDRNRFNRFETEKFLDVDVTSRLQREKSILETQLNDLRHEMSEKQRTFQTCIDGLNAELGRLQNELVFSHQQKQNQMHVKSDTENETEDERTSSAGDKTPLPVVDSSALLWHDEADVADEKDELSLTPITPVNTTRFTQLDFEMLQKENEELRAALADSTGQLPAADAVANLTAEVEKLRRQLQLVEEERSGLQQQLVELQQAELLHEMQDAEQNERIAQLENEIEANRVQYESEQRENLQKQKLAEQRVLEQQRTVLQDAEATNQIKLDELIRHTAEQDQRLATLQRELNEKRLNEDARKNVAAQWQPSEWYEQNEQVLDAVALAQARRDAATSKKALENARARIILLEADQDELKKQLETVRTEHYDKIAELVTSHSTAEAELQAEILRLKEAVVETAAAEATFGAEIPATDDANQAVHTAEEIAELKRVLAESSTQNSMLQAQLASAEDEKHTLIAATQQKLGELADEIERLTNELAEKSAVIIDDLQNSSGSSVEAVGNITQQFELDELQVLLEEARSERDEHSRRLSALEVQLQQAQLTVRQHETQLANMTEHYEHRMHELQQQLLRSGQRHEQDALLALSKTTAGHSGGTGFGDWDISDDEMTLPSVGAPPSAAALEIAEQQAVLMAQLRQDYEKQIAELQQQLAALARQTEVTRIQQRQRTTSSASGSSSASASPTSTIRPISASHVGITARIMPDVVHADSQTDLEAVADLASLPSSVPSSTTSASTQTDAADDLAPQSAAVNESPGTSRSSSATARLTTTPPHIASIIHTNAALELREQLEDKLNRLAAAEQKLATLSDSYQSSLAALNNEIKRLQKLLVDNDAERTQADAQAAQISADQAQLVADLRRRADEQRELVQQCEQVIADKNASFAITTRALDEQISTLKAEAQQLRLEKDDMLGVVAQYEGRIEESSRALESTKAASGAELRNIRAEIEAEVTVRIEAEANERSEAVRRELTEHFTARIGQLETSLRRADSHYQQIIQELEIRLANEQNEAEERLRAAIAVRTQRIEELEVLLRTSESNYMAEIEQLKAELAAHRNAAEREREAFQKPTTHDAEIQAEFESLMENNDSREELENMRTAFTEQLGELDAALSAKTAACEEAELEKRRVTEQLTAAQTEVQQLKQQQLAAKDQRNAEIIVLKQQADNIRTELTASMQAKIDAERQKLQASNEALRAAEAEVSFLNERTIELQERCQKSAAELADAQAALKSRAALCQQLTDELHSTTSELAAIKTQNDSQRQTEKIQYENRIKQLQSEYEANRTDLQAQLQRARADLARQTQLYNELKHQQHKMHETAVTAGAEPGESVALFAVDEHTHTDENAVAALAAAQTAAAAALVEQQKLQRQLDDARQESRRERDRLHQQLRQAQHELAEVQKFYSAEREIVARLERELQQLSVPTPTATAASSEKVTAAGSGGGWEHGREFDEEDSSSSSSASLSSEFAQQLADVRQQLVEANRLLMEQQKQHQEAEETNADELESREKLAAALIVQQQNYSRLEQQLQEAEHEIDAQKNILSNFEARVHELEEANSQLVAEKAELETLRERLMRGQADYEKEIHTLNQLLNDAGQALSDKQEQQQNFDDRMRQLENELKDAKALVLTNTREFEQQLDTVVQAEQHAVSEAQNRLDEATRAYRSEVEDLTFQVRQERDRSETLQRDLLAVQSSRAAEMHAEKVASERKISALETKIAELLVRESELAAIVAETDAVKRQLSTANARVRELEREQVRAQKQHDELTLHNAHLSELRAMQTTSETELRTTAQKLQAERDEARAAALVGQNSVSTAQAEVERLQRAHAELERQLRDNKQAVEVLQLQQRSAVSLGSSTATVSAFEKQPKVAPELAASGPYTREKQEEYEQKISQLEHSRNDATEQLRFANSARQQVEQRLRDARQSQQRLEAEVLQLQTQLDQVKTNKIEVLYTNKALEYAHTELEAVRKELHEARHSLQTEYDRSRRQQAALAAGLQQRNAELSETQKQLVAAQKDSGALEQRLEDLRSIHKQLQQECNKAQIELGRNDQALLALRGSEAMTLKQAQVSVAEYTALGEQLVELRAALTRRNEELRVQEQNVAELVREVESLRRQLHTGDVPRAVAAVQTDDEARQQWSPTKQMRNVATSAVSFDAVDPNRAEHEYTLVENAENGSSSFRALGQHNATSASSITDMSSVLSPLRQIAVDSRELYALCQSPHFQQLMALVADGVFTIADLHQLSTTVVERRNSGLGGETFAVPRASSAGAAAAEQSRFTTTSSTTSRQTTTSNRRPAPEELHQLDQHFRHVVNSLYNTLKAHKLLEKFAEYLRDLEICQRHYADALMCQKRHAEELEHDTQLIEEKLSKQISILEEKQAVQKRLIEQQQNADKQSVSTSSTTVNANATEVREQLKLCSLLERTLEEARAEQRATLATLGERERQLAALQRADKLRARQMVQIQQQLDTAQKTSAQRDVVYEQMEREVESLRRRVHVLQASLRHTEHLFSNMLMKVTNSTDEFFILPSSSIKVQEESSSSTTAATANQSNTSNALTLFSSTTTTAENSHALRSVADDDPGAEISLISFKFAEASAQRYRGEYMRAERFRRMLTLQKLYLIRLFSSVERMCCDAATRASISTPKTFDDTADRLLLFILRALRPSATTLYPAPDSPFYPLMQRSKTLRQYAVRSPLKRFKGCVMLVRAVYRMQREAKMWKSLQLKTQRMKSDAEALRDLKVQRNSTTLNEHDDDHRERRRDDEQQPSRRRHVSTSSLERTKKLSLASGTVNTDDVLTSAVSSSSSSSLGAPPPAPFLRSSSDTNYRQRNLALDTRANEVAGSTTTASSKAAAAKPVISSRGEFSKRY